MGNRGLEARNIQVFGAAKPGDLIPVERTGEAAEADTTDIPDQEEFFRSPARFGSIPVEAAPLGWDRRQKFNKLYPFVSLPTQVVERVSFGDPGLEPNRLLWGDNLHVMRQLPSESVDLIYIDPPFFSGRQYNVIFGDRNEMRSFSDVWEGGMPGYLEWLNARLFEMKRILKSTGSLIVHLDWHASHYVKQELDKIFGLGCALPGKNAPGFRNEIAWCYLSGGLPRTELPRKHDVLFWYSKGSWWTFNPEYKAYTAGTLQRGLTAVKGPKYKLNPLGTPLVDWWSDIGKTLSPTAYETIGYPTQKPEALLARIVNMFSAEGDVVADFFVGGGTTAAVAQRLGRRWIACDQSRVAVAVTADRLAKQGEQALLAMAGRGTADFTIEHWGTYEAARLSLAPHAQFQQFVLDSSQLRRAHADGPIHAFKGELPVWIGPPDRNYRVSAQEVVDFGNAVRKLETFRQGALRSARMIAWAFSPGAQQQAKAISDEKHSSNNYLDVELVRIESEAFREHIVRLGSEKADYGTFLTFTRPPEVVVGKQRVDGRTWKFDLSDTLITNDDAKIINVQWDFDYRDKRFTSSLGYKDLRTSSGAPKLIVEWTFPRPGPFHIACKVQDDLGGEGFYTETMTVE